MKWIDKVEYDFLTQWMKDRHIMWEEYFRLTHRQIQ